MSLSPLFVLPYVMQISLMRQQVEADVFVFMFASLGFRLALTL